MTAASGPLLDWGWAQAALDGEHCGDAHVVSEFAGGALVGVVDGLGHGFEAAVAARTATRLLASLAGQPLDVLVERCHEALRRTRGAVLSLASFDAPGSAMTWGGIGNVEAVLLRAHPAPVTREALVPRGGIVGFRLPALNARTLPVAPGDLLVLATDGVHDGFAEGVERDRTPREIAEGILARHARGTDDALVLVARWRGAPGPAGAGEEAGA
jgi:negative regulator of sigma-B (phosphoserine phosphatase)